jgi:hypothetical protein
MTCAVAATAATLGSPAALLAQQTANQASQAPITHIQGFHVVLVVGETQPSAPAATQPLPEGARRALDDMREFLPYKHYRVLDALWSSCCSGPQTRISGRLQGVLGVPGPDGSVRLVQRPYVFNVVAVSVPIGIQTRFVLTAQDGPNAAAIEQTELELKIKNTQDDLEMARMRAEQARRHVAAGTESELNLREMENRLRQLEREMVALRARREQAGAGGQTGVMDSSFTMAVGETVVVGTSRLGGDKALVALITAVPKGTK